MSEHETDTTPEPAPETTVTVAIDPSPEPAPEGTTPHSSHASERNADEDQTPAEFRALVRDNHRLMTERVDQLEHLLQTLATRWGAILGEMEQTTALAQEMIGRIDETVEKAGQQTAALVKVTQTLAQIVAAHQAGARR